jgi:hypothetical protein
MRKLRAVTLLAGLLALLGCAVQPARAQFLGYVSPQSVQQVLAPSSTACTGSAQVFPVTNLGQTQHYAYIAPSGATSLVMVLQALDAAGNIYRLADDTLGNRGTANVSVAASGYFPKIQVSVTCLPATTATFTLNYSGSSATFNQTQGAYLLAQQDKIFEYGAAAGTGATFSSLLTPYGNAQGIMTFNYAGSGPSGSTISVSCSAQTGNVFWEQEFALSTTAGEQFFPIAAMPCPAYTAIYTPGGASATTYTWEEIFQPVAASPPSYVHITGTTATVIDMLNGTLDAIVLGTPAAGTITVFDLAYTACSGTPATNIVSVLTVQASAEPSTIPFSGALFQNGICVKASATMDFTVVHH